MRVTVTIDDDLLKDARAITGVTDKNELFRKGITFLLEREHKKQSPKIGGTKPPLKSMSQRQVKG